MKVILTLLLFVLVFQTVVVAQTDSAPATYTNSFGMEFVLIPPGSVTIGSMRPKCPTPPDDRQVTDEARWTDEDYHRCEELARRDTHAGFEVAIGEPFYLGKYEVTQQEWEKVMGSNPSFFHRGRVDGNSKNHPVENVTWGQAKAFIARLNELDTTSVYRLPTEFEWEYAAKAGADSLLSWKETKEQAWIQDTNKGSTIPVGQLKPNAWGLYDMLGNVWEWTEDFHNGKFLPDTVPPATGEVHVLRGGSFTSDVTNATFIFHGGGPGNGYDVGLRIVREAK